MQLRRPIAALSLGRKVAWDAGFLDDSAFGREALAVLRPGAGAPPLIGLGLEAEGLTASIALPLVEARLLAALDELLPAPAAAAGAAALEVDARRRVARAHCVEVVLTPTQLRLLELLVLRRNSDLSADEILETLWGTNEGLGGSELVRAHIRNLRFKLAQLGLEGAIRSRRGRGYALVV